MEIILAIVSSLFYFLKLFWWFMFDDEWPDQVKPADHIVTVQPAL